MNGGKRNIFTRNCRNKTRFERDGTKEGERSDYLQVFSLNHLTVGCDLSVPATCVRLGRWQTLIPDTKWWRNEQLIGSILCRPETRDRFPWISTCKLAHGSAKPPLTEKMAPSGPMIGPGRFRTYQVEFLQGRSGFAGERPPFAS